MINGSTSVWLGITFVVIGAINVWLILETSARVRNANASDRLVAAHRIGGYLFIGLFCAMGYFMVARLGDAGAGASPVSIIHLTLAMVLSPLLFVKVLVARYYKSYHSLLMPIGLVIFVLSVVLIGVTAGPYLARQTRMQTVALTAIDLPPATIDMNVAAATMEKRCSKCHNLDRVAGARKDAHGWLATVDRMRLLPDSGISEADSRMIVSYLASRQAPRETQGSVELEVARALVDQRCGRCHSLDRVYGAMQTPSEWRATVTRMVSYAAGSTGALQPGEDNQIIAYLSATQTPDAVNRRQAQATAVSAAATGLQTQPASGAFKHIFPRSGKDVEMIGFLALVCVGMLTLIVRRPARAPAASAKPEATIRALQKPGMPASAEPLILRLASITAQTSNAKTLRFIVPSGRKLHARPGQFLTFSFLFDGKKVTRSYSICSSPARTGYFEITTKRVSGGCASIFLNDRASVGMTVEAKGPSGEFCFDENQHDNVVLVAAGSGITPMMAILRYLDDLCVPTAVTLFYCVRTIDDIIFENELADLQSRLKNFRYHVLLSAPHNGWSGPRGHISREFIEHVVKNPGASDFFLCGPAPFMDVSREALIALGVKPERIRQESFGGAIPGHSQSSTGRNEGAVVEFERSGATYTVRSGQTLLEAAEEHGVSIPSSCRQGQCGTCKTKLLSGSVRMDLEAGLDPQSRAQGFVLTCVGHAEGAVKLDA